MADALYCTSCGTSAVLEQMYGRPVYAGCQALRIWRWPSGWTYRWPGGWRCEECSR